MKKCRLTYLSVFFKIFDPWNSLSLDFFISKLLMSSPSIWISYALEFFHLLNRFMIYLFIYRTYPRKMKSNKIFLYVFYWKTTIQKNSIKQNYRFYFYMIINTAIKVLSRKVQNWLWRSLNYIMKNVGYHISVKESYLIIT